MRSHPHGSFFPPCHKPISHGDAGVAASSALLLLLLLLQLPTLIVHVLRLPACTQPLPPPLQASQADCLSLVATESIVVSYAVEKNVVFVYEPARLVGAVVNAYTAGLRPVQMT